MVTTIVQFVDDAVFYLPKMMAIIGIAETNSEHPIASAITKYVKEALKTDLVAKCTDFHVNIVDKICNLITNYNFLTNFLIVPVFVFRLFQVVAFGVKCLILTRWRNLFCSHLLLKND